MTRFAIGLLFLASSVRAETADDVLKRWDVAAKDFHAFSADLKQTEVMKIIKKTDHLTAVVRLKRTDKGAFGIVKYTDQNPHTYHFLGDTVEEFKPGANQKNIYDAKKFSSLMQEVLMLGFGTSGKEVRKTYVVTDGGTAMIGSKRTTRIELVPREKAFKERFEKFEIWVPEGENNPVQVKATQASGDYAIYEYSNVQLLKLPLKESDFDYDPDQKPDKSTHVVRL